MGVAGKDFPLNKFPGKMATSVGFMSKDGRLYRNLRHDGNLIGERYQEGKANLALDSENQSTIKSFINSIKKHELLRSSEE